MPSTRNAESIVLNRFRISLDLVCADNTRYAKQRIGLDRREDMIGGTIWIESRSHQDEFRESALNAFPGFLFAPHSGYANLQKFLTEVSPTVP